MNSYPDKLYEYLQPTTSNYAFRIAIPTGIIGGFALIVYFLILRFLDLHMQTNLRWINFVLVIPVMVFALNKYVNVATSKTYLEALVVSITACITAYLMLGIFMIGYLMYDTVFMEHLYQSSLPELQLSILSIFLLIMLEGIVGGVVLSFVILQFFIERIRKAA